MSTLQMPRDLSDVVDPQLHNHADRSTFSADALRRGDTLIALGGYEVRMVWCWMYRSTHLWRDETASWKICPACTARGDLLRWVVAREPRGGVGLGPLWRVTVGRWGHCSVCYLCAFRLERVVRLAASGLTHIKTLSERRPRGPFGPPSVPSI